MKSQEMDLVPSAIDEMPKAELENFHISGRAQHTESAASCNRAEDATLSNPEDRVTDEETAKPPFSLPDELLVKVLGYLPIQDRFRLETVCQQWQRCMYLEVENLYLNFCYGKDHKCILRIKNVDGDYASLTSSWIEELPAVLHKLKRSKVGLMMCIMKDEFTDRKLFGLLADIANKSIKVVVHYDTVHHPANLVTFCDFIGPHITTFQLNVYGRQGLPEDIQAFANSFARMKRLKELRGNWLDLIFTCLNSFPSNSLPHFQEMELQFIGEYDQKLWEHFKSIYGAQIKKITFPCHWGDDEGEGLLPWKKMASFANLQILNITFWLNNYTLTALAEDLEATTRSCPLLKSFGLKQAIFSVRRVMVSLTEVRKLFLAIGKMKMLEKLALELSFGFEDFVDISSGKNLDLFAMLENKSSITHLKANVKLCHIGLFNIRFRQEIYGSLNIAMPKLRHLDVFCMASELVHFVGLERMQTISLYLHSEGASESIQDSLIHILKSSPSLKSITVCEWFVELSEALIGTIMEVAELQMEKHIHFICKFLVFNKSQKTWDALRHLARRNLILIMDDNIFSFEERRLNII